MHVHILQQSSLLFRKETAIAMVFSFSGHVRCLRRFGCGIHLYASHQTHINNCCILNRRICTSCFINNSDDRFSDNYQNSDQTGNEENKCGENSSGKVSFIEHRRRGVLGKRRKLSPAERITAMIGENISTETVPQKKHCANELTDKPIEDSNKTDIKIPENFDYYKFYQDTFSTLPKKSVLEESNETYADECLAMTDTSPSHSLKKFIELQTHSGPEFSEATFAEKGSQQIHNIGAKESIMLNGEFVLVIIKNAKSHEKIKHLIKLHPNSILKGKFGTLLHRDVIGLSSGCTLSTATNETLLVRRPSLEEYVKMMPKKAAVPSPKDCVTMLMMIDACPGDVILEAGTGSAAMTLFLSRAVSGEGDIHTFEENLEYQMLAKKNFQAWRNSWDISHRDRPWPDNVSFHHLPFQRCDRVLTDAVIDGAIIGLETPHTVLPVLASRLQRGKAAAFYVTNITQIIEISEFLHTHKLPLYIEDICEVTHTKWLVHPAGRHDRKMQHPSLDHHGEENDTAGLYAQDKILDRISKYTSRSNHKGDHHSGSRSNHKEDHHSAFLVKIRRTYQHQQKL